MGSLAGGTDSGRLCFGCDRTAVSARRGRLWRFHTRRSRRARGGYDGNAAEQNDSGASAVCYQFVFRALASAGRGAPAWAFAAHAAGVRPRGAHSPPLLSKSRDLGSARGPLPPLPCLLMVASPGYRYAQLYVYSYTQTRALYLNLLTKLYALRVDQRGA